MKKNNSMIVVVLLVVFCIVSVLVVGVYNIVLATERADELESKCEELENDNARLKLMLRCSKDPALLVSTAFQVDSVSGRDILGPVLGDEWDGDIDAALAMIKENPEYADRVLIALEDYLYGPVGRGPQAQYDPNDPAYAEFGGGPNH